ncbi:MAG: cyclophilin-like fold protein [Methanotrichaceae archaeon]|nr:cyclophilin-like fold protein [Methanotrichaceae archaeon]
MRCIEIDIRGRGKALAELDERNPLISDALYQKLPIEARANLWGEEVYFEIPLEMENENPSPSATPGDISYWAPGPAFCIFFGQTQPYSPVNHLGRVIEGLGIFRNVMEGDRIVLNRK